MWGFAVGIYFISLNPTNLQGVAANGIMLNLAVIFFGAAIGDWIDRTPRKSSRINHLFSFSFTFIFSPTKSIIFSKSICCIDGYFSCNRVI